MDSVISTTDVMTENTDSPSCSLNSWTAVDDDSDKKPVRVGGWSGTASSEEMTRDEDFLLIDGYLTACALTEFEAASCDNVKRTIEADGEGIGGGGGKRRKT